MAVFTKHPSSEIRPMLERGLARIAHRGPHGRGLILGARRTLLSDHSEFLPDWGIGHVRLAILDLSRAGEQPMPSCDRAHWIAHNGEVYNYRELRSELEELGHSFASTTDTEVILAAYRQWGEACVERFNGMFAFIVVDLAKGRIFVARDRLGVKPIYFWRQADTLVIVSEPKQLSVLSGFRAKAHAQQVVDFLLDGVVGHEPGLCFFEGVHPLRPGYSVSWELGTLPALESSRPYWQAGSFVGRQRWSEAVEQTGYLFRDATRLRLRSEVPVGSCLSGGIDSSAIVGVVGRELGRRITTFSSCSDDLRFDERIYIDAVNDHCGAEPLKVFPSEAGITEDLEKVVYCQDEPFSSLSVYAQWCVTKAAGEAGFRVLLDGQGGDETLCGYRKYAYFYLQELLATGRFPDAGRHVGNMIFKGDRGLLYLRHGTRYLPRWLRRRQDRIDSIMHPDWQARARRVWSEQMRTVRSIQSHQVADLKSWSLPSLLRYQDRNSAAFGVETRLPFLDHRFVEHCLTLPAGFFFKKGQTKRLLVEALDEALPAVVRNRRTKMGFEIPSVVWMRGQLGSVLEYRVRKSQRLAEILDSSGAGELFRMYRNGSKSVSDRLLFRIAGLALWLDTFKVDLP